MSAIRPGVWCVRSAVPEPRLDCAMFVIQVQYAHTYYRGEVMQEKSNAKKKALPRRSVNAADIAYVSKGEPVTANSTDYKVKIKVIAPIQPKKRNSK